MGSKRSGPYLIGDLIFRTKTEAERHIRSILHNTPLGHALNEEDAAILLALLDSHPNRDAKIGVGVESFLVRMCPIWRNNRQFVLVRTDGTSTDFSFKECLSPASPLQMFKRACRHAIADQILAFRNAEMDRMLGDVLVCPVLRIPVAPDGAQVDHEPPLTFDSLVLAFIEQERTDIEAIRVTGFGDNEMRKDFEDSAIRERWQEFHRTNARLRLVSKKANLSNIRRLSNTSVGNSDSQ